MTPDDQAALSVWNLTTNGMGGIDWAGLPVAAAMAGVEDVEMLVTRLLIIKTHRPQKD